jgi:hypothetical protein
MSSTSTQSLLVVALRYSVIWWGGSLPTFSSYVRSPNCSQKPLPYQGNISISDNSYSVNCIQHLQSVFLASRSARLSWHVKFVAMKMATHVHIMTRVNTAACLLAWWMTLHGIQTNACLKHSSSSLNVLEVLPLRTLPAFSIIYPTSQHSCDLEMNLLTLSEYKWTSTT